MNIAYSKYKYEFWMHSVPKPIFIIKFFERVGEEVVILKP